MTGDSQLKPYTSWADFVQHLKHPESLINFIAAYGTHSRRSPARRRSTASAPRRIGHRRSAASATPAGPPRLPEQHRRLGQRRRRRDHDRPRQRRLSGSAAWPRRRCRSAACSARPSTSSSRPSSRSCRTATASTTCSAPPACNFVTELENNSFAKLIMANTDATHLPALVFQTPAFILEVDQTRQFNGLDARQCRSDRRHPIGGVAHAAGHPRQPRHAGPDTNYLQYTGAEHVVLGGTAGNDILIASDRRRHALRRRRQRPPRGRLRQRHHPRRRRRRHHHRHSAATTTSRATTATTSSTPATAST